MTLDLHAPQIQGFFRVPVDDLTARPYLCAAIERVSVPDPVVVSPEDVPAAFADWLANQTGQPIIGGPAGEPPDVVARRTSETTVQSILEQPAYVPARVARSGCYSAC